MSQSNKNDGSIPMTRARDERFAAIVAGADGGLSLARAWCLSDPAVVKPKVTPGRRVSASNAGKRVADRVAWLKQQHASVVPIENLTTERISNLMERTTIDLMAAARHAQKVGSNNIAQQLRKALIIHAGRSSRLKQSVPAQDNIDEVVDVDSILSRLYACICSKELC